MSKPIQLQLVFDKTYNLKNEIKAIKADYRQLFENSLAWKKLQEDAAQLASRKKSIIAGIEADMEIELNQLSDLKQALKDELMLLSDKALSDYTNGVKVEVVDKKGYVYEPIFSVKFKKTNLKNYENNRTEIQ